jgi:hypothetical protein
MDKNRNLMSKYWLGTSFESEAPKPMNCQYLVYQQEQCPTTQKLHWQFFVIFNQRQRFTAVKKMFGNAHLEIARDPIKARNYCMKEDTRVQAPIEEGHFGEQADLITRVKRTRLTDLVQEHPWKVRQLKELKCLLAPRREYLTDCILLTGPTGTGKTKISATIAAFLGQDGTYWQDSTQWWDNYDQEPLVIIDEFRGQFPEAQVLRLVDRVPYRVPIKGSYAEFDSRMIILTSNLSLEEMYPKTDTATLKALGRRIRTLTTY